MACHLFRIFFKGGRICVFKIMKACLYLNGKGRLSSHYRTKNLEAEFRSELELTRIVSGRRTAVETTVAGALAEGVDIGKERCRRTFVETIEKVETFGNQIETEAFAEPDRPRDS